jgi:hypothetical protein
VCCPNKVLIHCPCTQANKPSSEGQWTKKAENESNTASGTREQCNDWPQATRMQREQCICKTQLEYGMKLDVHDAFVCQDKGGFILQAQAAKGLVKICSATGTATNVGEILRLMQALILERRTV